MATTGMQGSHLHSDFGRTHHANNSVIFLVLQGSNSALPHRLCDKGRKRPLCLLHQRHCNNPPHIPHTATLALATLLAQSSASSHTHSTIPSRADAEPFPSTDRPRRHLHVTAPPNQIREVSYVCSSYAVTFTLLARIARSPRSEMSSLAGRGRGKIRPPRRVSHHHQPHSPRATSTHYTCYTAIIHRAYQRRHVYCTKC